jgi:glycosyltransferase involved in cell wall biosynthesis
MNKFLGVLLCYNDADILDDAILHILENNHDLIVWDHGSDDDTARILDKYDSNFAERMFIPRSFDFYRLYQKMSRRLIEQYIHQYDWISWPDQDEFLEGPDRSKSYCQHLEAVFEQGYDYIQFNNFNYWFTAEDDQDIVSPIQRINHYGLFPDCAPRIRAWRAAKTNIRKFNHNPIDGLKVPVNFNLRHYPMRSQEQMLRRLNKDRANLQRGSKNFHYNNMATHVHDLSIQAEWLHCDDGIQDLNHETRFNWRNIYGYSASQPQSGLLKPLRWLSNLF